MPKNFWMIQIRNELPRLHKVWLDSKGEEGERLALRGACLKMADLSRADLQHAILNQASLTSASLIQANLRYSIMGRANFSSGSIRNGVFCLTDLRDSNLTQASFNGSNFTSCSLIDANMDNVTYTLADVNRNVGITPTREKAGKKWRQK
jgi:uncharacterized protein YjbI with pentapeptide repeats